ncbi:hypothetical protein XENTR_v10017163 [Xenopus tropicalis]|nr:hypothetical protein XENTR_v10017163 [Xenopus tropicalis]
MFQMLNNMFARECSNALSQETKLSEKEDDEWILVDFIGELTSMAVKTSPMENLLIEHPSMSVYAVHNMCHKPETSCESGFPSPDRTELATENKKKGKHIHCSIAALAARIKGLENTKIYLGDKLTKLHLEKHPSRKGFRRQNLIRGCRSQQTKHSRLLVHQPSPRQYNY